METYLEFCSEVGSCVACELSKTRTNVVVGRGNTERNKPFLFIGEAPGKEEDESGEAFVGQSGELLNKYKEYIGIQEKEAYTTNILKCRPPNNANPKDNQIEACSKNILWQIRYFNPIVIISIGIFATTFLLGKEFQTGIKKYRGRFFKFYDGRVVYPVLHPSFFIRKGGKGWEEQLNPLKSAYETMKENGTI